MRTQSNYLSGRVIYLKSHAAYYVTIDDWFYDDKTYANTALRNRSGKQSVPQKS